MRSAQRGLVTGFAVPSAGIPPSVVKAAKDFEETAFRLTTARVAVEVSRLAVEEGIEADQAAFDKAVRKGDDNATLRHEAEADGILALADAERRVKVLEAVVDESGDAFARQIGEAKAEWLATLDEKESQALAAYTEAVDRLESVMTELGDARVARAWLDNYDTSAAITADQNRKDIAFRVRPARFPLSLPRDLDHVRGVAMIEQASLFASLRGAVAPTPEPPTTTAVPAKVRP